MSKKYAVNKENHYKNIISKQKKIIQELKKKSGRAHKLEDRYNDIEEREAELALLEDADMPAQQGFGCPKCSGELYVIDGNKRKIFICQDCEYKGSKRV